MQNTDAITITYTSAGLDYVRRVLGTRPYDEVASMIMDMQQQVAQQQLPDAAKEKGPDGALPVIAEAA